MCVGNTAAYAVHETTEKFKCEHTCHVQYAVLIHEMGHYPSIVYEGTVQFKQMASSAPSHCNWFTLSFCACTLIAVCV